MCVQVLELYYNVRTTFTFHHFGNTFYRTFKEFFDFYLSEILGC